MKVLLIGKNGQLGWELTRSCPKHINIITCDFPQIDLCSFKSIESCIDSVRPEVIINAAAYTAVDKAEQEKELAYKINHEAVAFMAGLAEKFGIRLVHISTDFVFSGNSCKPWTPFDQPTPVSVYGKSKWKGEKAVAKILGDNALVLRTAWLYSAHGQNFVKTMIRLMKEKKSLSVIDDQYGTPTWAKGLAQTIWSCIAKKVSGTHHWTDAGVASWYDFAVAIQEEATKLEIIRAGTQIAPVPTSQYPTDAIRPHYSVLNKSSLLNVLNRKPIHWRIQLRHMLKELSQ
jgi:dTDP-4-dehydrorhamnose reductase